MSKEEEEEKEQLTTLEIKVEIIMREILGLPCLSP